MAIYGNQPAWYGYIGGDMVIFHKNFFNDKKIIFPFTYTGSANYANPYMVLPLFATRFADYAGGIRVSFIQSHLV